MPTQHIHCTIQNWQLYNLVPMGLGISYHAHTHLILSLYVAQAGIQTEANHTGLNRHVEALHGS